MRRGGRAALQLARSHRQRLFQHWTELCRAAETGWESELPGLCQAPETLPGAHSVGPDLAEIWESFITGKAAPVKGHKKKPHQLPWGKASPGCSSGWMGTSGMLSSDDNSDNPVEI